MKYGQWFDVRALKHHKRDSLPPVQSTEFDVEVNYLAEDVQSFNRQCSETLKGIIILWLKVERLQASNGDIDDCCIDHAELLELSIFFLFVFLIQQCFHADLLCKIAKACLRTLHLDLHEDQTPWRLCHRRLPKSVCRGLRIGFGDLEWWRSLNPQRRGCSLSI